MDVKRGIRCLLLISICVALLPGCATILSEKKYPVTFDNTGGPTFFAVHDRKNRVIHEGVTPQQVTLDAKAFPFWRAKYDVTFAGQNNSSQRQELKARVDPWIAGNILVGGVPGVLVDGATGAMWKLPERISGGVPTQFAMTDLAQGSRIAAAFSKPHNTADDTTDRVSQVQFQTAQYTVPKPYTAPKSSAAPKRYTAPKSSAAGASPSTAPTSRPFAAPQATMPQIAPAGWPYSQPTPSKPESNSDSACVGCSHG